MSYDAEAHLLERGYQAHVLQYTYAGRPVHQIVRSTIADDALCREVGRVLPRSVEDHAHETNAFVHPAPAALALDGGGSLLRRLLAGWRRGGPLLLL